MIKASSNIQAIAVIAENAIQMQKEDLQSDIIFEMIARVARKCQHAAEVQENLYLESQNTVLQLQKKVIQLSTESAMVALEQNDTSSGREDNTADDMPF